ncbi:MAG: hypothetical protein J4N76_04025 [Chloroflexi bacterium]|nr:hypothetical protein [Chloroflexota bacterium]MCI0771824.1 hypothetical protein [Chloroflexota bacterium]MCI0854145.1 hypothetical protein [Chloroflexota bacterium]MCI0860947.1 hypothetical protein [Chloroflexota bacterium]MCI0875713.1 hypothetical protein [Chloroflexota bacterium]
MGTGLIDIPTALSVRVCHARRGYDLKCASHAEQVLEKQGDVIAEPVRGTTISANMDCFLVAN